MKKYIIGLIALLVVLFGGVAYVSANPNYFSTGSQTSSATTSPTWMGPGTFATTTLTFDSYAGLVGSSRSIAGLTLLIAHTASTSNSVMTAAVQYSQDCIDYYDDNNTPATTTVQGISGASSYTFAGNVFSSTTRHMLRIPPATRCVRAQFSASVASSSLWAQFVPTREIDK